MNNTEMTTLSSLLIELSYLIVHGVTSKINTLLIHFMSFLLPIVIAAYIVPLFVFTLLAYLQFHIFNSIVQSFIRVAEILQIGMELLNNVTILTRFNKIAIQGTPQMAVDKEAIRLSRVYSYDYKCIWHYSMCNPP